MLKKSIRIIAAIALLAVVSSAFMFGKSKATKAFGITLPAAYSVRGIDVSRYQQNVNWAEIAKVSAGKDKSQSINFAFIKATEGKTFVDVYFRSNWKESKKNNIIRGAYHYYKPNINSKLQANNFIKVVKLQKGDLPPVLDIEEIGKYGTDNMKRGLKNWLTTVEKQYGVKPIIYCFYDYYNNYFKDDKDFKDYPFWIAHHHKMSLKVKKGNWHFWQHSDKAKIKGIKGKVCFNAFSGDLTELKKLCVK